MDFYNDLCMYLVTILHMMFQMEPENIDALQKADFTTQLGQWVIILIIANFGGNILGVILSMITDIIKWVQSAFSYVMREREFNEQRSR